MTTRRLCWLSLPKKDNSTHRRRSGLGIDGSGFPSKLYPGEAGVKGWRRPIASLPPLHRLRC